MAFDFNTVYLMRYGDEPVAIVMGVRQRDLAVAGYGPLPHVEFLTASDALRNWHQVLGEVIEDTPDRMVVRPIEGYYGVAPDPTATFVFEPLTLEAWMALGLRQDEVFSSDDELQGYYREAYLHDWWTETGEPPTDAPAIPSPGPEIAPGT